MVIGRSPSQLPTHQSRMNRACVSLGPAGERSGQNTSSAIWHCFPLVRFPRLATNVLGQTGRRFFIGEGQLYGLGIARSADGEHRPVVRTWIVGCVCSANHCDQPRGGVNGSAYASTDFFHFQSRPCRRVLGCASLTRQPEMPGVLNFGLVLFLT